MVRVKFITDLNRWRVFWYNDAGERKRFSFMTKEEALKFACTVGYTGSEETGKIQGSIAGMFRDYRKLRFEEKAESTKAVEVNFLEHFF